MKASSAAGDDREADLRQRHLQEGLRPRGAEAARHQLLVMS